MPPTRQGYGPRPAREQAESRRGAAGAAGVVLVGVALAHERLVLLLVQVLEQLADLLLGRVQLGLPLDELVALLREVLELV